MKRGRTPAMKCETYGCRSQHAVALTVSDSPHGDQRPLWRCQKCVDAFLNDERELEAGLRDGSFTGPVYHLEVVDKEDSCPPQ